MSIRNPQDSALLARVEVLEEMLRANPLVAGSFGQGGITVYDGGKIRIEGPHPILIEIIDGAASITVGNARLVGNELGLAISTVGGNASLSVGDDEVLLTQGSRTFKISGSKHNMSGVIAPDAAAAPLALGILPNGDIVTMSGGGGGGGPVSPGTPGATFKFPYPRADHRTYDGHSGADWPYGLGTPIPAIGPGTVIDRSTTVFNDYGDQSMSGANWAGNHVIVDHGTIGGHNIRSLYAHMTGAPLVAMGATILGGQTLGRIGNSGFSRGAHLHLEIIFDGVRLPTGSGGYERTIGWLDANASSSWA